MAGKIKEFFQREDINTGRQKNIDYAKAIAIFGMVLVHVMIYPYFGGFNKGLGFVIGFILGGLLSAPVFMTSMGFGLCYTGKNDPKLIIKRGLKLVALNFILNALRSIYCIPAKSFQSDDVLFSIFFHLFNGDILLFAGLAMILFGLLKFIKKNSNLWILIIAFVMVLFPTFFRITSNDNRVLAFTLGLFIPVDLGGEPTIYFQLCSWFIYVALGNMLAVVVRKIKNLNLFYIILGCVGAIMATTTLLLDKYCHLYQFFDTSYDPEYYAGLGYALISFGVMFVEFAIFHFVCKITPEAMDKVIYKFSSMINEIYCVQWILILNISYPVLLLFVEEYTTNMWPFLISFSVVFPLSIIIASFWRKWKRNRIQKKLQAAQSN